MMLSLPDVPRMPDPGLYELLQAMRRQVIENTSRLVAAGAGGGSTGAAGGRDPLSLVMDYASNVGGYLADADARDLYVAPGEYTVGLGRESFNKSMDGRGHFVLPDRAIPANFGYMAVKPTTWPAQGLNGWFRGDQWFTDGGEWKVIGPGVRTYDITARYFESNTIPHHVWWEVESGNSGTQAYLTNGVTPGNSVTLAPLTGVQEWVGKQVQIKAGFGGAVLATLTVASVAGSVITFTTAHGVTMAWNPAIGQAPCLSFAPRTWGGHTYVLVRMRGGGDVYGHIVRMNVEYQPKLTELVHTFNGGTGGQYGGSVDFVTTNARLTAAAGPGSAVINVVDNDTGAPLSATQLTYIAGKRLILRHAIGGAPVDIRGIVSATATTITLNSPPASSYAIGAVASVGPDGCYATGWESQYNDQGSDVSVIAQVDSFVRQNDRADQGGKVWMGTFFKSDTRPADVAHCVAGQWRRGLDTSTATLTDGSYLTDPAAAAAAFIAVKWVSGARKDHQVILAKGGYVGTIVSITGNILGVTPPLNAAYPVGTIVDFPSGGAAVSMKRGQWINWDASADTTGRSADPLQVWGPLYGNKTGIIWSGTGEDVSGVFWATTHGDARIRLRSNSFNTNVVFQGAMGVIAGEELTTNASAINGSFQGAVIYGGGLGEYTTFNAATGKYEFYINNALVYSIPP